MNIYRYICRRMKFEIIMMYHYNLWYQRTFTFFSLLFLKAISNLDHEFLWSRGGYWGKLHLLRWRAEEPLYTPFLMHKGLWTMLNVEREEPNFRWERERENQPGVVLLPWSFVLNAKWKKKGWKYKKPLGSAQIPEKRRWMFCLLAAF